MCVNLTFGWVKYPYMTWFCYILALYVSTGICNWGYTDYSTTIQYWVAQSCCLKWWQENAGTQVTCRCVGQMREPVMSSTQLERSGRERENNITKTQLTSIWRQFGRIMTSACSSLGWESVAALSLTKPANIHIVQMTWYLPQKICSTSYGPTTVKILGITFWQFDK